MKVLKEGRKQEGWSKEYTCTGAGNGGGGCGAELLVSAGDFYKTHNYDYGGGHDVFITFQCPCCKVETDVKDYRGPRDLPDKSEWLAAQDQVVWL